MSFFPPVTVQRGVVEGRVAARVPAVDPAVRTPQAEKGDGEKERSQKSDPELGKRGTLAR